ncbi:hypothetical protein PT276_05210 [Orbaceae bacterium ESL0721]|nr:hypothetical protein [Orbaceae bacterium ESL0721]
MKFWKIAIVTIFMSILLGCSSKYVQPRNVHNDINGLTQTQIKKAILSAGQSGNRGWVLKDKDGNNIQGVLFNRGYEAKVNIQYSSKGYTIQYVSVSDNLKDKQGNIHRNYNRWVNNLDQEIRRSITYMSNQ